ncbi:MAG: formate--tetrahydrofolate ligase [Bacilli bacterium]|nr:formate--tetrahydrofolate ligase [Bacilli bacterium]
MKRITEIADKLGVKELELYGDNKAKINDKPSNRKAKLILVTATNPTKYGEGKTTISISLADALNKIGKKTVLALREPSMGPVFGIKGGATGGGKAKVEPEDEINLHFTGDFHAITSANDLLCAAIDNHIYFGNELKIKKVIFKRCLDVNDRALREGFNITAASEIMALFCLAKDMADLKEKLGNIVIGYNEDDEFIYAKDLGVVGSMAALLKDAIKPNLVQTLEETPTLIHGGPFANIAHGCNSVIATNLALSLGDYVVTEAGFGADLGAEKFFDIKCRLNDYKPDAVVLVTTIRALKYNGEEDLKKGIVNLEAHIDNLTKYTKNLVVCLNRFDDDTDEEVSFVEDFVKEKGIEFTTSTGFLDGSDGSVSLAEKVVNLTEKANDFKLLYEDDLSLKDKISTIAKEIYHAKEVVYTDEANAEIEKLDKTEVRNYPVCIAKTQYSISDDPKKLGYPKDTTLTIKGVELYNGAGFLTVLSGSIIKMPGLARHSNYENIDVEGDKITGII